MGTQSCTPDLWGLHLEIVLMGTHGKTRELVGQCGKGHVNTTNSCLLDNHLLNRKTHLIRVS